MDSYVTEILMILIIISLNAKVIEPTVPNLTTSKTFMNRTGNSTDYEYNYEDYEYSKFAQDLEKIEILCWKILAPTFLVVGVTGNTLSILVLRR